MRRVLEVSAYRNGITSLVPACVHCDFAAVDLGRLRIVVETSERFVRPTLLSTIKHPGHELDP